MFYHGYILASSPFGAADVPADGHFNMRTFQNGDFLAQGLFGKRIFWHRSILAQEHFGTLTFRHSSTSAEMSVSKRPYCFARCQNIHVLKCSGAEISPWRNVLVLKSPSAGTFTVPNSACAKMFPWWSIRAEMTLPEMFQAEMVYRRKRDVLQNRTH